MSLKKFLTTAEISNFFGLEEETVRSLVETGELKALADRGTWKYRREDVENLIKQGRLHPTKEMPTVDDVDFDSSMGFADDAGGDDRTDFLELDEDALAGASTMISGGPTPQGEDLKLSFSEEPETSSSDVRVFEPSDSLASDSDIMVRGASAFEASTMDDTPSSSDVQPIEEVDESSSSSSTLQSLEGIEIDEFGRTSLTGGQAPVEGIVLDLDDSSGKLQQPTMGGTQRLALPDIPDAFADEEATIVPSGGTSRLEVPTTDVPTGGTARMTPPSEMAGRMELPAELSADSESVLSDEGLATSEGDSGLTFEYTDSGLTLDTGEGDSAIGVEAGDSGLTLDAGDSGLTLDAGDSGLTLDGGDSGLSLELADDDAAPAAPVAGTQRMEEIGEIDENLDFDSGSGDSGGTRRLAVEEKFAEERAFIDDEDEHTSVIMVDDEDEEAGDYVGTLSGAIEAGEAVEDLDVAEDLDRLDAEGDEEFGTAEAAVVDANDEAFSDDMLSDGSVEDEDTFAAPVAQAKTYEPSWGAFTAVMVMAAAGLVATNAWLMWEGAATMWDGSEPSGPAAAIISTIGGMLG